MEKSERLQTIRNLTVNIFQQYVKLNSTHYIALKKYRFNYNVF
jgi:hypothetical protein